MTSDTWRVTRAGLRAAYPVTRHPPLATRGAFTLVEVLVVMTLLSLIVLALMAVFNSTQTAFRASVTQTDVLEGGRAATDLMASDLRQMSPSLGGVTLQLVNFRMVFVQPINFYANTNVYNTGPLVQSLPGSTARRVNVLQNFFALGRGNVNGSPAWIAIGYAVNPASQTDLNPLYRFYMSTNTVTNPWWLFYDFTNAIGAGAWTNWSHLLNGVVTLTVHAYDTNGVWMTNGYSFGYNHIPKNTQILPAPPGGTSFYMFSNTLPASVEIELGVLEDRTLQRAATWPNGSLAQSNYLAQQAGKVHVFRQRVTVPNVDPSAYQ